MGTRQGTLLEKNILKIFKQAGFRVKHQERIKRLEYWIVGGMGAVLIILLTDITK